MKINNPPPPESAKNVGPTYVQPEVELPKPEPPQNVEPKKVEQTYSIMPNNSLSILGKRIEDLKQREKDAIVRYADANRRISEASMRGLGGGGESHDRYARGEGCRISGAR